MAHRLIRITTVIGAALLASGARAEIGYGEGALAVAALSAGDWQAAEAVLAPVSYADARDPARLINLAAVYARTGRMTEARETLLRAASVPDAVLVLASGEEKSSRAIVRSALARVNVQVASR